jgi:hypothetical protein
MKWREAEGRCFRNGGRSFADTWIDLPDSSYDVILEIKIED